MKKASNPELMRALVKAQAIARRDGPVIKDFRSEDGWWWASLEVIDARASQALDECGLALVFDGLEVRPEWVVSARWTLMHLETGQVRTLPFELPMAWTPAENISLANKAKGITIGIERYMLRALLRIPLCNPHPLADPPRPPLADLLGLADSKEVPSASIGSRPLVEQCGIADDLVERVPVEDGSADLVAWRVLSPLFDKKKNALKRATKLQRLSLSTWLGKYLGTQSKNLDEEVSRLVVAKAEEYLQTFEE